MFHAQHDNFDTYLDTQFIRPTLNLCERLFSQAQRALIDYRKKMSSIMLKSRMFLYVNRRFLGIIDGNEIV